MSLVGRASGVFAALYLATVTAPAWAQAAPPSTPITPPQPVTIGAPPGAGGGAQGPDAIYLKSGAVVRGTIGVAMPGAPITIQLPNGVLVSIQWDTVDHIDRTSTPGVQAPPPPPPVQAPPPPVQAAPAVVQPPMQAMQPVVTVHIDADDPEVILQTQVPGERRPVWMTVCAGPCDRPIPLGVLYRISGDGIRSSKSFEVMGQPGGRAHLVASTTSSSAFTSGVVLVSVGSAAALIGLSLTLVGLLVGAYCGFGKSCTGDAGLITAGLVTTGIGATGIIVGAVMAGGNARSSVQQVGLRSPVLRF